MRFLSVCSGIEAASAAWHPLGWHASAVAEIEPFPSAVLSHHFPEVPNLGDFTRIVRSPALQQNIGDVSLLVGGTPCQSFSVAGLRGGLSDERGNLALEFVRLAAVLRPRWILWENVPGVLSSGGGRDFGAILGAMVELGYGWAYRVLDAQYFGVPQRRRRVFLVGHSGGSPNGPAQVLFEREGVRRDSAARGQARQEVAGTLGGGPGSRGWSSDTDRMTFVPAVSPAVTSKWSKGSGGPAGDECQNLVSQPQPIPFDTTQITSPANRSRPAPGAPCHPLSAGAHPPAICFPWQIGATQQMSVDVEKAPTLIKNPTPAVSSVTIGVRRLTPTECERLQGFSDGWTDVPYRGKPASDGPRYKALGNSMAVPVMRWIGERIKMVDEQQPAT